MKFFFPIAIFLLSLIYPIILELRAADSVKPTNGPPNILFILTDDQRWDGLGCYGNSSIRTPAFDKLSSEGSRLDAYYVASPLCCPSRASFLTGLYPHQNGVIKNDKKLPPGLTTVADILNKAGYITGFVGKAHLDGNPKHWGFKEAPVYFPLGSIEKKSVKPGEERLIVINGKTKEFQGNITEIFANAAISFLETHQKDRWFLWFATTAPHQPFMNYPEFPYRRTEIISPPGWPLQQPFRTKGDVVAYYSTISMLDQQVGRILKKLEDLGLAQNTFVFMASDNGYMLGSHGITGKEVWYEESTRVPAIARWPGKIKPKTIVKSLLSNVDFLPTIMDLAGVDKKIKGVTGISMLPSLMGNPPSRLEIFSEVKMNARDYQYWQMIRTGQFKYVKFTDGKEYLYDLKADPSELNDLSHSKDQTVVKQELLGRLNAWIHKTPEVAEPVQKPNRDKLHEKITAIAKNN